MTVQIAYLEQERASLWTVAKSTREISKADTLLEQSMKHNAELECLYRRVV